MDICKAEKFCTFVDWIKGCCNIFWRSGVGLCRRATRRGIAGGRYANERGCSCRRAPLLLFIGLRPACLEKLIDKLLLARAREPVVTRQPRLELREVCINDIRRVGDSAAHAIIPSEQVGLSMLRCKLFLIFFLKRLKIQLDLYFCVSIRGDLHSHSHFSRERIWCARACSSHSWWRFRQAFQKWWAGCSIALGLRCTQPHNVTSLPASARRSSPQVWVLYIVYRF